MEPRAFHSIGEVADELGIPQHTLRFWESRFWQIQPLRRGAGRRYYRAEDVALLRGIQRLLYVDHVSIRGVQKILQERTLEHVRSLAK